MGASFGDLLETREHIWWGMWGFLDHSQGFVDEHAGLSQWSMRGIIANVRPCTALLEIVVLKNCGFCAVYLIHWSNYSVMTILHYFEVWWPKAQLQAVHTMYVSHKVQRGSDMQIVNNYSNHTIFLLTSTWPYLVCLRPCCLQHLMDIFVLLLVLGVGTLLNARMLDAGVTWDNEDNGENKDYLPDELSPSTTCRHNTTACLLVFSFVVCWCWRSLALVFVGTVGDSLDVPILTGKMGTIRIATNDGDGTIGQRSRLFVKSINQIH